MKIKNKKDFGLGIFGILFSAWIVWYSTSFLGDARYEGDPGPKLFPIIGAVIMFICSVVILIKPDPASKQFLSKKRFLDRQFLSDDQLEMLSGVYYPYWLGQFEGDAAFEGEGTKVKTMIRGNYNITRTRYYHVSRKGHLRFKNLQRKALHEVDRKLSDGIHPFDMRNMKPFSMSYLSGFFAEKRDIEEQEAGADMEQEVRKYVPGLMEKSGEYSSLTGKTDFSVTSQRMRYVLLPAWVLTYQGRTKDKPYYFMMNGQTGTVCGRLPLDRKKLLLTSLLLGAVILGILCLGGALIW